MDANTLEWAKGKIRDEIKGFADDPHGYCGDEIPFPDAWSNLDAIARDLGVDAATVLVEEATPCEISRLRVLIGLDFG